MQMVVPLAKHFVSFGASRCRGLLHRFCVLMRKQKLKLVIVKQFSCFERLRCTTVTAELLPSSR